MILSVTDTDRRGKVVRAYALIMHKEAMYRAQLLRFAREDKYRLHSVIMVTSDEGSINVTIEPSSPEYMRVTAILARDNWL